MQFRAASSPRPPDGTNEPDDGGDCRLLWRKVSLPLASRRTRKCSLVWMPWRAVMARGGRFRHRLEVRLMARCGRRVRFRSCQKALCVPSPFRIMGLQQHTGLSLSCVLPGRATGGDSADSFVAHRVPPPDPLRASSSRSNVMLRFRIALGGVLGGGGRDDIQLERRGLRAR